jgi:hypothetical protein
MDSNPIAVELGLDDPNGPGAVLRQATEVLGEQRPDGMPNLGYMYFIDACEKLFDGELEVVLFEEHMRWFFGNQVGDSRTRVRTRAENGHAGLSALHVGQAHCRIYQAGQGYFIHSSTDAERGAGAKRALRQQVTGAMGDASGCAQGRQAHQSGYDPVSSRG